MATEPSSAACELCGRTLPDEHVVHDEFRFCCAGCRDVHTTLGPASDGGDSERGHTVARETNGVAHTEKSGQGDDSTDADGTASATAFLRVDGMHSVTCESYLASIAERQGGVSDAEASYVTETVRVDYDPDRVTEAKLCETLSTVGYSAYPRDEETEGSSPTPPAASHPRNDPKQVLDDTLGYRYAAAVLFGIFLMIPYVVVLYPNYLAGFMDSWFLEQLTGEAAFKGAGRLLFLQFYALQTAVVLFFAGMPLLRGAYVSLAMRRPDTHLLVSVTVVVAYVYTILAMLAGRPNAFFDLTLVVAAVVVAAIFYESVSKQRALGRLTELTVSQVDEARLLESDGTTSTVRVDDLAPGDSVLVRQGERIPVDGVLEEGTCTVDEAVVTGESIPVVKRAGDDLVGGSVVTDDAALLSVGDSATSSIDRLLRSVWDIQSADHGVQRRANELAGTILPPVVAVAILVAGGFYVLEGGVLPAVFVFLTVLLVATPWGLGLATPLSVATSIEQAMNRGIVVFDETVFERLRDVDVVVFDKTGTLTTGEMEVLEADGPPELLEAAATLERRASHPAANAIVETFGTARTDGGSEVTDGANEAADDSGDDGDGGVSEFANHTNGVQGLVDGSDVLVGNLSCFRERGWSVSGEIESAVTEARGFGRLPVVVGRNGQAAGLIVVGDEPRDGWDETLTRLGETGTDIVILTGDDAEATDFLDRHPHVDEVFSGVPPDGKTATIGRLQADGEVAMVGDGTNDAPALARADLGITLGSGTALASDAADVAIVEDHLPAVTTAFDLAKAARRRLRRNNALALAFNVITIPFAVLGLLNPLVAMLGVVVTCCLLVANVSRPLIGE